MRRRLQLTGRGHDREGLQHSENRTFRESGLGKSGPPGMSAVRSLSGGKRTLNRRALSKLDLSIRALDPRGGRPPSRPSEPTHPGERRAQERLCTGRGTSPMPLKRTNAAVKSGSSIVSRRCCSMRASPASGIRGSISKWAGNITVRTGRWPTSVIRTDQRRRSGGQSENAAYIITRYASRTALEWASARSTTSKPISSWND